MKSILKYVAIVVLTVVLTVLIVQGHYEAQYEQELMKVKAQLEQKEVQLQNMEKSYQILLERYWERK